ncbi:MAG: sigma-70 family RNA polymerase sigma factor [Rubripirellula sp.]
MTEPSSDPEESLRASWSIGPLRPWLLRIAKQEIPVDLRGKVDPSDLVQQTLLDAWRADAGFQGQTHGQRLAWLRVILRRVVLQQRRGMLAVKRGEGNEKVFADAINRTSLRIEELAVGREPAPEEKVADAELALLVAQAIDKLSEDYRRVIELRHFQQESHASIAAKLNRSPAASRMLWVRALVELKRIVTENRPSSGSE